MMFYLLVVLVSFSVGIAAGLYYADCQPHLLEIHDPNKPFTSAELRRIGIIPPERYDEWLDEFARR